MTGSGAVVGIDGGGTTTDVVVADLTGAVLSSVTTGATNHESIGVERVVEVLAAGIEEALDAAGVARDDVRVSVFGLAGVDWPSDVVLVGDALSGLDLGGRRVVVNDSRVALRAGCSHPSGIVSSVGTGSVTAGVNRAGEWFRSMAVGWGEPRGSGTLVSEALHAIAAEHHGTAPATALTPRFLDAFGQPDVPAMFESITRGRSGGVRGRAPLVVEVAAEGDDVARAIVATVAVRHAAMVAGVASRLGMTDEAFELVTSGGVHAGGGQFSADFAAAVVVDCPHATIVPLTTSPALGAVGLALDELASDSPTSTGQEVSS
jgi:N-acetylglucosamine kinase-like BadF-type ATPase